MAKRLRPRGRRFGRLFSTVAAEPSLSGIASGAVLAVGLRNRLSDLVLKLEICRGTNCGSTSIGVKEITSSGFKTCGLYEPLDTGDAAAGIESSLRAVCEVWNLLLNFLPTGPVSLGISSSTSRLSGVVDLILREMSAELAESSESEDISFGLDKGRRRLFTKV